MGHYYSHASEFKKLVLIWSGVFFALLFYLSFSYFFSFLDFGHFFLYRILPLVACLSSVFSYYYFQNLTELISQKKIRDFKIVSQKILLCWGANEVIAFCGFLYCLSVETDFSIGIFYFVIAFVLNFSMSPKLLIEKLEESNKKE